jgi:hypothetical protein
MMMVQSANLNLTLLSAPHGAETTRHTGVYYDVKLNFQFSVSTALFHVDFIINAKVCRSHTSQYPHMNSAELLELLVIDSHFRCSAFSDLDSGIPSVEARCPGIIIDDATHTQIELHFYLIDDATHTQIKLLFYLIDDATHTQIKLLFYLSVFFIRNLGSGR